MTQTVKGKKFNLEERTLDFAQGVRLFVKKLPRTVGNLEDAKQVVRSSGSVGANYIEANESLSKKDFTLRMKIARKEAKETRYWLQLLHTGSELARQCDELQREATELIMILSAIITKTR